MMVFRIIFIICVLNVMLPGCSVSKFSTKLNDIDSVIRIVNPDHNCTCDNKDKTVELRSSNGGKLDMYYFQQVYFKTLPADAIKTGEEIKGELIKFIPELGNYRRIYLEYSLRVPNDTSMNYQLIGTVYFLRNKCSGFMRDISAKDLIKKSHNKKFESDLCIKK